MAIDLIISRLVQSIDITGIAVVMQLVSEPGRVPLVFAVVGLTVIYLYLRRLRWEALVLVVTTGIVSLIGWWLKYLINRSRPEIGQALIYKENLDPSFPSGHVLLYTVFFGFLFYVAGRKIKNPLLKIFTKSLLAGFVILIGPSRIYLGEHWFTDTLAGYLLGFFWLWAAIGIYRSKRLRNLFF